ncbi:hypothetical protein AcV7_003656 [Taiwanofungus camphoratus]|nr:hypothetical protein AcV7_003656 [Antrodia cinnamomea]
MAARRNVCPWLTSRRTPGAHPRLTLQFRLSRSQMLCLTMGIVTPRNHIIFPFMFLVTKNSSSLDTGVDRFRDHSAPRHAVQFYVFRLGPGQIDDTYGSIA